MTATPLIPGQPVPDLHLSLVNDTKWRLSAQKADKFVMIVFYRGLHCPICRTYMGSLTAALPEFAARGVEAIAVSTDKEDRAKQVHREWGLGALPVGYDLPFAEAQRWGLYISKSRGKTSIGIDEPPLFAEPGLFLIKPDQTLYFASIQTMPFARPPFAEVLKAIDFILKNDYPPRGQVVDLDVAA